MEGTIAEIRYFAGNFAPKNWAFCQGQLLSISSNTALFSLLGTNYGGNGQSTFGLPDFRSRIAVGAGQSPGLSNYVLGQLAGVENFTIQTNNFPAHTHAFVGNVTMAANATAGNADAPQNNYPGFDGDNLYSTVNNGSFMGAMQHNLGTANAGNLSPSPVSNLQPVLGMNFVICLFGVYPSRD